MKRKTTLLGLGSMIMVAAPLTVTISCGGFDDLEDQQDQGLDLGTDKPDENKSTTFDVGLSEYKPYNFVIKESFYNVITEQADDKYKTDDQTNDWNNDGITYGEATKWLEMIAPTNDGRHMAGVDVWLAKEISKDYNAGDVVLHEHKFDDLISEMNIGSFDAIISGMSATESRTARGVTFTNPYYKPSNGILYRKDTELGGIAEESVEFDAEILKNYKGSAELGSVQHDILSEFLGESALDLSEGSLNMETGVATVVGGHETGIDYIICENTLADYFKEEYAQDTVPVELGYVNVAEFNKVTDNISVGLPSRGPISKVQVDHTIERVTGSVGLKFDVASEIALENHKDIYQGHTSATQ